MGAPAIASTRGRYAKQNRLTRVQGPGGVDVSYQYDSLGRMLTRTSGGVTTKFTWDGWNCVKEDDGTNVLRWYCPEGELHSFERNSTFYQVHSDALGSVRAITDSSGAVVGNYSYGAWGETTSATHPSGFTMPYGYVGGLGVRYDSTTGLHYMRNRWYDSSGLQRFLSRDELEAPNSYEYCHSNPINWVDINGLEPSWPTPGGPTTPVRPIPGPIRIPTPVRPVPGPLRVPTPRPIPRVPAPGIVGILMFFVGPYPDPDEVRFRHRWPDRCDPKEEPDTFECNLRFRNRHWNGSVLCVYSCRSSKGNVWEESMTIIKELVDMGIDCQQSYRGTKK